RARVWAGVAARVHVYSLRLALAGLDPDPGILSPEGREEFSSHHRHRIAAPDPIARAPIIRGDECHAGSIRSGAAPGLRAGWHAVRARVCRAWDPLSSAPR